VDPVELHDLQDWFAADELDACPRCLQAAAITMSHADALLCFACGFIRWPGGETSVRELQLRPGVDTSTLGGVPQPQ
jgi:ribosomal protein S27AE